MNLLPNLAGANHADCGSANAVFACECRTVACGKLAANLAGNVCPDFSFYRSRQHFFDAPSKCDSSAQYIDGCANLIGPVGKAKRLAVKGNQVITALVATLFRWRSPPHVSRLVVAIVVRISIKCMAIGWARPNVCNKRQKRFGPSFAYTNPASTISLISSCSWAITAVQHLCPKRVERMLLSVSRAAVIFLCFHVASSCAHCTQLNILAEVGVHHL